LSALSSTFQPPFSLSYSDLKPKNFTPVSSSPSLPGVKFLSTPFVLRSVIGPLSFINFSISVIHLPENVAFNKSPEFVCLSCNCTLKLLFLVKSASSQ
jgi:hypothetical protein